MSDSKSSQQKMLKRLTNKPDSSSEASSSNSNVPRRTDFLINYSHYPRNMQNKNYFIRVKQAQMMDYIHGIDLSLVDQKHNVRGDRTIWYASDKFQFTPTQDDDGDRFVLLPLHFSNGQLMVYFPDPYYVMHSDANSIYEIMTGVKPGCRTEFPPIKPEFIRETEMIAKSLSHDRLITTKPLKGNLLVLTHEFQVGIHHAYFLTLIKKEEGKYTYKTDGTLGLLVGSKYPFASIFVGRELCRRINTFGRNECF
jgi:hypothetical protein